MRELDDIEIAEINQLKEKLAKLEAKKFRQNADHDSRSGAKTNPIGEIGGIRSRSPKRKRQMFDRWTRDAKDAMALEQAIAATKASIKRVENTPRAEQRKAGEAVAAEVTTAFTKAHVRAGDRVEYTLNPRLEMVVEKVNKVSVSIAGWPRGERVRIDEIFPCKDDGTFYSIEERVAVLVAWGKANGYFA